MGAAFHEIQRRPQPGCALSRQGRHIVGTCGRHLAMAETAQRAGFERAIGFDMGGTSTDVSLFTGQYERDNETMVAGARIRAPMLCIHTVAAGGGSICASEDGRLIGGPGSAGAFPEPLLPQWRGIDDHRLQCRARQGPAGLFPALLGPGGNEPLDAEASRARLDAVAAAAGLPAETAAEGLITIAVASMANAIKATSSSSKHPVAAVTGKHRPEIAAARGIDGAANPFALRNAHLS